MLDADLAGRMNTRLVLGALAERTGTVLVLGPTARAELEHLVDRFDRDMRAQAGEGGVAPHQLPSHDLRVWKRTLAGGGHLEALGKREVTEHGRRHARDHAWLRKAWASLDGDPMDLYHVDEGMAVAAAGVLTGNTTSIDAAALRALAAKDGVAIPAVMKRDACIDYFAARLGVSRVEALEQAVLPNARGHADYPAMWGRFLPKVWQSFPETVEEKLDALEVGGMDHAAEVEKAEATPADVGTRSVLEATVLRRRADKQEARGPER